jgi:hypothetical protein
MDFVTKKITHALRPISPNVSSDKYLTESFAAGSYKSWIQSLNLLCGVMYESRPSIP